MDEEHKAQQLLAEQHMAEDEEHGRLSALSDRVIKPCPLCKEKEELSPMDDNGGKNWCVICWQCDYLGPSGGNASEAIYLHNEAVL